MNSKPVQRPASV